jgi:hypothetical protein
MPLLKPSSSTVCHSESLPTLLPSPASHYPSPHSSSPHIYIPHACIPSSVPPWFLHWLLLRAVSRCHTIPSGPVGSGMHAPQSFSSFILKDIEWKEYLQGPDPLQPRPSSPRAPPPPPLNTCPRLLSIGIISHRIPLLERHCV